LTDPEGAPKVATALVPFEPLMPNVEKAVASMRLFQRLKSDLLDDEDVVMIGKKKYIKRSGWRKIALSFGISTKIVSVEKETLEKGDIRISVKAEAIAPNGRVCEEIASCSSSEVTKSNMDPTLHNIETKAATRAINRAISDLVGGGEVSAEEIQGTTTTTESPVPSSQGPASPGSGSDLTNEQLDAVKWTQSAKLPQLKTILVNDTTRKVPIIALLYERLKTAANETWKIGEVTYKLSRNDEGTEWLQKWSSPQK
jgi:hypothetical protein